MRFDLILKQVVTDKLQYHTVSFDFYYIYIRHCIQKVKFSFKNI